MNKITYYIEILQFISRWARKKMVEPKYIDLFKYRKHFEHEKRKKEKNYLHYAVVGKVNKWDSWNYVWNEDLENHFCCVEYYTTLEYIK